MSEERITALLSEAAQWHLIGLLFEYPDDSWRSRLQTLLPDLRQENLRAIASVTVTNGASLVFNNNEQMDNAGVLSIYGNASVNLTNRSETIGGLN